MKMKPFRSGLLLFGAASVSLAGVLTDDAVALAKTDSTVDRVAEKAAAAVVADDVAPSAVLAAVLAARTTWSSDQVALIYRSVLLASGLSGEFSENLAAYRTGGVKADSAEGVKLLGVLYQNAPAAVADAVVGSVLGSATPAYASTAVGRQVSDSAATKAAADVPPVVVPTPPPVSSDN